MSEFEKERDYNLTVIFDTTAGKIISDKYYFNTTLQHQIYPCKNQQEYDADVYKLVMIISVCVVALILLILAVFAFRVMVVWIRERHGKIITESVRGLHNAMVQNPIYEGPLYETLDTHAQFSNVNNTISFSAATKNNSLDHTTNTASDHEEVANSTLRYVKQSSLPQKIESHAHIPPMEGQSTDVQCHAFNGSLTVPVPVDMEDKYTTMTQANTAAMD